MKLKLTFWLALLAIMLALSSVAVRVARGTTEEFSDIMAPIAVSLLLCGILVREWSKGRGTR